MRWGASIDWLRKTKTRKLRVYGYKTKTLKKSQDWVIIWNNCTTTIKLKFLSDEGGRKLTTAILNKPYHFQFITKLWTYFRFFTFWVRLDFDSWSVQLIRFSYYRNIYYRNADGCRQGKSVCDWFKQLVNRVQFTEY